LFNYLLCLYYLFISSPWRIFDGWKRRHRRSWTLRGRRVKCVVPNLRSGSTKLPKASAVAGAAAAAFLLFRNRSQLLLFCRIIQRVVSVGCCSQPRRERRKKRTKKGFFFFTNSLPLSLLLSLSWVNLVEELSPPLFWPRHIFILLTFAHHFKAARGCQRRRCLV